MRASHMEVWLAALGLCIILVACGGGNNAAQDTITGFSGLLPLPDDLARQVSVASYSTALGIDYQTALAPQNIADLGDTVMFSPTWDAEANPVSSDLAYALYAFDVSGGASGSELRAGWSTAPTEGNAWIGAANFDSETWDWFPCTAGSAVSLANLTPYTSSADELLAVVLLTGTASAQLAWLRLGDEGQSGQVEVRLPSDDACGNGGELQLRIFAPAADATYFPEGAPVCVQVPGGQSAPTLATSVPAPLGNFVHITWYAPGVGPAELASDGTYDDRGPVTLLALRDVTRYALGELTDSNGRTLQELLACNVLYGNVGLMPMSNGGPLCWATLALYGSQLTGLSWVMGWENPTNSQVITAEAGRGNNVVSEPGDDPVDQTGFINPQYSAWGVQTLTIDYSNIAYDSVFDVVYLERGGLPRFDLVADPGGALTSDLDGDGLIGPGEDWGLSCWTVDGGTPSEKRYFSLQAVQACYDYSVWTVGSEPAWLPTIAEAQAFWQFRDATVHFADVGVNLPALKVIICGSEADHVQTPPDYPHLHQSFSGLLAAGIDVKLGPSPDYVVQLRPDAAGHPGLPDYDWNEVPSIWSTGNYTLPEIFDTDSVLISASIYELADLIQP